MSDRTDIVCLSAIPARGAPVVKTQLKRVVALQTAADQIFAINNSCLHKASSQAKGIMQRADDAGRISLTANHLRAGSAA
ncbi:MAG: hypothetical protein ABJP79_17205 [Tateyamaria sp.]|uniref:hypothetical protein n=1 Tax=Tateyamaria sp. TaxID=1929288 RepID=UPI00329F9D12